VTLTAREIAEITRLLEDSSFDELHLEIDGLKLHLRRGSTAPAQPADASAAAGVPAQVLRSFPTMHGRLRNRSSARAICRKFPRRCSARFTGRRSPASRHL
jgi:hypothetical protein